MPAALGRVEFDLLEEGREEEIVARALQRAILTVWRDRLGGLDLLRPRGPVRRRPDGRDHRRHAAARTCSAQFDGPIEGLHTWMQALGEEAENEEVAASVVEFVLEGLHLGRRVNKADDVGMAVYGVS